MVSAHTQNHERKRPIKVQYSTLKYTKQLAKVLFFSFLLRQESHCVLLAGLELIEDQPGLKRTEI